MYIYAYIYYNYRWYNCIHLHISIYRSIHTHNYNFSASMCLLKVSEKLESDIDNFQQIHIYHNNSKRFQIIDNVVSFTFFWKSTFAFVLFILFPGKFCEQYTTTTFIITYHQIGLSMENFESFLNKHCFTYYLRF